MIIKKFAKFIVESLQENEYERIGKYDKWEGIDDMEDAQHIIDFWDTPTVKFSERDLKGFNSIFDNIVVSQTGDRLKAFTNLNKRYKIYIKKFADEYYGIKFHDDDYELPERYYRCDQWNGLLVCLKNELNQM